MLSALPFMFTVLMGASCVENNLDTGRKLDEPDASPLLVVWPDAVDFGMYRKGEGGSVVIAISNEGTAPLSLNAVRLEADAGFELVTLGLDMELEPGGSTEVEVVFTAFTLEHEGRLVVESTDPAVGRAVVPLDGAGQLPALFVYPDPYDFGRIEPDCTVPGMVTVQNIGTDTLVVDALAQVGEGFELEGSAQDLLPLTLEPGASSELPLAFTPADYVPYDGELWFSSNAAPYVAIQTGEGSEGQDYVDEWTQPISGQADIMFYVDQSCSMEDDKERLVNNFDSFIEELEKVDTDYLVMVVTNDQGCHNMTYIERDTADKRDIFSKAVSGNGGMFTEAGLTITAKAMAQTDWGECNGDFNREGSTISVVLISDEPEQSPPVVTAPQVVGQILQFAPSTYINAVVGPVPDGCDSAEPGFGYDVAATLTGGLMLNICNLDWGKHLVQLAEKATVAKLASLFYLSGTPESNSIEVFVDGKEVTAGWTYLEDVNGVEFDDEHRPGEGEHIRVEYSSAVTCDQ